VDATWADVAVGGHRPVGCGVAFACALNAGSRPHALNGHAAQEALSEIASWTLLNITSVGDVSEESIIDVIEEASSRSAFVLVDLEGIQSTMVSYAVSMADLVIVPMQASQLDAPKAASMIRLIKQQERVARRSIPYVLALTRTNPAIITGTQKHIERSFVERDIPVMTTKLFDREAYRALFSFGGTLATLKDKGVSNLDTAQRNAHAFTVEIIERLKAAPQQEVA